MSLLGEITLKGITNWNISEFRYLERLFSKIPENIAKYLSYDLLFNHRNDSSSFLLILKILKE